MKRTNISIDGVQVAAFGQDESMTFIIKKTKSGHYFWNIYFGGEKYFCLYERESGRRIAEMLGITLKTLNNKLFDSTLKYQWKKNHAARMAA